MKNAHTLDRREFLKISALAGGGLMLALHLPGWRGDAVAADGPLAPNVFIAVDGEGRVTFRFAWNELGQGAMTSLTMVAADELDVDPARVVTELAPAGPEYGNNVTGGSSSMRRSWEPLRRAAATAREMLKSAAAERWGVTAVGCRTENGFVIHPDGAARLGYGDLAAAASALPVPEDPPLKPVAARRLVGTRFARLDTPDKVAGRARFGLDLTVEDGFVAVAARCPVQGGSLKGCEDSAARAVPGVREVVSFDDWVAVLADDTWSALRGRDALKPDWDLGPHAGESSATLADRLAAAAAAPGVVSLDEGGVDAALAAAPTRVEAEYVTPLIAHAPMEPMNCVADFADGRCTVTVPSQASLWARDTVAQALDLPPGNVTLQPTLVGGAFGRRLWSDFAVEAALLSRKVGRPVQLVWSREDDFRHDFFRPPSRHRLVGGLDAQGRLTVWTHRVAASSISKQNFPGSIPEGGADEQMVDGVANSPYAVPARRVEQTIVDTHLRVGWWRAVYNNQSAFANECFLDELAHAAGRDPVDFRLDLLGDAPRLAGALRAAAERSGWPRPSAAGRGLGVACHESFGSQAAVVAEVSVDDAGRLRAHRVVSVLECGVCVNPDAVRAQMEGAVAMALGETLRGRIDIENGRVVQGNFDQYALLRLDEMPAVETHILESGEPMGGVGEPPVPPVAPAIANAVFAAAGLRLRELPLAAALAAARRG